jgi:predicted aspartyl protease
MRQLFDLMAVLLLTVMLSSCGRSIDYLYKRPKAVKSGYVTQKGFIRQVPFEMHVGNKIIIEAKLNGSTRTYRFIVDTGALSALSAEAAEELGLIKPGKTDFPAHVVLDKVEIAGLDFHKVGTIVYDVKKYAFLSKCAKVDGMIGTSVLKHFIWHIDFRNEKIFVSDTPDSLPSASSAISLPFTVDSYNRALVNCTFPNGQSKKFIFDTGGNGFITSDKKLFEDLKQGVQYKVNYGLAGWGEKGAYYDTSYTARITNFKVAHLPVDTVDVLFVRGQENHVGWHFLHNYSVRFNWQERKIELIPYPQQIPLGNPLSFGHTFFYQVDTPTNEMRMIVAAVVKDSPAHKAGLKIGDRVVAVDGKDYQVITSECELFEGIGSNGKEMQLTILQGDQRQLVTVKAEASYQ